jgi:hypothetical protein
MFRQRMFNIRNFLSYIVFPYQWYAILPYAILFSLLFCIICAASRLLSTHFWFLHIFSINLDLLSIYSVKYVSDITLFNVISGFSHAWLFTATFVVISVLYLLAIYWLPDKITVRFIFASTIVLGLAYMLLPVLTSQDVFSYIAYSRMAVLYHLDPVVTVPTAIRHDYIFHFLYWVHQPSIYGPVWTALVSGLQCLALALGFKYAFFMEMALRLFCFAAFLTSVCLLWILIGRFQSPLAGTVAQQRLRLRVTLAFAWNPFLLLEACVNAHNDVVVLLLFLLALYSLLPSIQSGRQPFVWSAFFIGLASCIKISYILLIPGLLLFVLFNEKDILFPILQRYYNAALAAIVAFGTVMVLYMPFWHHGELLAVLRITPSASRDINSIYELAVNVIHALGLASLRHTEDHGAPIEVYSHWVSTLFFLLVYLYACIRCLLQPRLLRTPLSLLGWLNFVWLAYCFIGSPWFWPWYSVIAIGMCAVIAACQDEGMRNRCCIPFVFTELNMGLVGLVISFSSLCLYIFWTFYGLFPNYKLSFVSNQVVWLLPLIVVISVYYRGRGREKRFSLTGRYKDKRIRIWLPYARRDR